MKRIFLSLLAFIIAFNLAAFLASTVDSNFFYKPDPQTQKRVLEFLTKHNENKARMYQRLDETPNRTSGQYLEISNENVDADARMDISRLPEDFQIAWVKYLSASREWSDFVAGLNGMPHSLNMTEEDAVRANEITNKQEALELELQKIADKYGVEFDGNFAYPKSVK